MYLGMSIHGLGFVSISCARSGGGECSLVISYGWKGDVDCRNTSFTFLQEL